MDEDGLLRMLEHGGDAMAALMELRASVHRHNGRLLFGNLSALFRSLRARLTDPNWHVTLQCLTLLADLFVPVSPSSTSSTGAAPPHGSIGGGTKNGQTSQGADTKNTRQKAGADPKARLPTSLATTSSSSSISSSSLVSSFTQNLTLGSDIESHFRTLVPALVTNLGDPKTAIQNATLHVLTLFVLYAYSPDTVMSALASANGLLCVEEHVRKACADAVPALLSAFEKRMGGWERYFLLRNAVDESRAVEGYAPSAAAAAAAANGASSGAGRLHSDTTAAGGIGGGAGGAGGDLSTALTESQSGMIDIEPLIGMLVGRLKDIKKEVEDAATVALSFILTAIGKRPLLHIVNKLPNQFKYQFKTHQAEIWGAAGLSSSTSTSRGHHAPAPAPLTTQDSNVTVSTVRSLSSNLSQTTLDQDSAAQKQQTVPTADALSATSTSSKAGTKDKSISKDEAAPSAEKQSSKRVDRKTLSSKQFKEIESVDVNGALGDATSTGTNDPADADKAVEKVEFGFVPESVVRALKASSSPASSASARGPPALSANASPSATNRSQLQTPSHDWKVRAAAIEQLRRAVACLEDTRALLPHLRDFLGFVVSLLEDSNFKITLTALHIVEDVIAKVGLGIRPLLDVLLPALIQKFGDSKVFIRQANVKVLTNLMHIMSPKPILASLLHNLSSDNARVREEIINAIIITMFNFPPADLDLPSLAADLMTVLQDRTVRVRNVAIEAYAVLANLMGGPERLLRKLRGYELDEETCSLLQSRFSNKMLPQLNSDGLVAHVMPINGQLHTSRPNSSSSPFALTASGNVSAVASASASPMLTPLAPPTPMMMRTTPVLPDVVLSLPPPLPPAGGNGGAGAASGATKRFWSASEKTASLTKFPWEMQVASPYHQRQSLPQTLNYALLPPPAPYNAGGRYATQHQHMQQQQQQNFYHQQQRQLQAHQRMTDNTGRLRSLSATEGSYAGYPGPVTMMPAFPPQQQSLHPSSYVLNRPTMARPGARSLDIDFDQDHVSAYPPSPALGNNSLLPAPSPSPKLRAGALRLTSPGYIHGHDASSTDASINRRSLSSSSSHPAPGSEYYYGSNLSSNGHYMTVDAHIKDFSEGLSHLGQAYSAQQQYQQQQQQQYHHLQRQQQQQQQQQQQYQQQQQQQQYQNTTGIRGTSASSPALADKVWKRANGAGGDAGSESTSRSQSRSRKTPSVNAYNAFDESPVGPAAGRKDKIGVEDDTMYYSGRTSAASVSSMIHTSTPPPLPQGSPPRRSQRRLYEDRTQREDEDETSVPPSSTGPSKLSLATKKRMERKERRTLEKTLDGTEMAPELVELSSDTLGGSQRKEERTRQAQAPAPTNKGGSYVSMYRKAVSASAVTVAGSTAPAVSIGSTTATTATTAVDDATAFQSSSKTRMSPTSPIPTSLSPGATSSTTSLAGKAGRRRTAGGAAMPSQAGGSPSKPTGGKPRAASQPRVSGGRISRVGATSGKIGTGSGLADLNAALDNLRIKDLDWDRRVDALAVIQRVAQLAPEVFTGANLASWPAGGAGVGAGASGGVLHETLLILVKEVQNLRSQVSRAAIACLAAVYRRVGKAIDTGLDTTVSALLVRSSNEAKRSGVANNGEIILSGNNFMGDEIDDALRAMVDNVAMPRALNSLLLHADHKNLTIRARCAKFIYALIDQMSEAALAKFVANKNHEMDKLLPCLVGFVEAALPETRTYGKRAVMALAKSTAFESALASGGAAKGLSRIQSEKLVQVIAAGRAKGMLEEPPPQLTRSLSFGRRSAGALTKKLGVADGDGLPDASPNNNGTAGSVVKPKVASKPRAPVVKEPVEFDVLPQLYTTLQSGEYKAKYDAITELMQLFQNYPHELGQPHRFAKTMDAFIGRLHDGNSKISIYALQSMFSLVSLMKDYMGSVLTPLVQTLVANLAATNAQVRSLSSQVIDVIIQEVDNVLLLQALSSVLQFGGNGKVKPLVVEKMISVMDKMYASKPLLVVKYTLPVAISLLSEPKGDIKACNAKLIRTLHQLMGTQLYSQAELQNEKVRMQFQVAIGDS